MRTFTYTPYLLFYTQRGGVIIKHLKSIYDLEEMIEIIKDLSDEKKDSRIKYYIYISHNSIKNYLNATEEDMIDKTTQKAKYTPEVINHTLFIIEDIKKKGITSKTQGERSISYRTGSNLPPRIKESLPCPYVKSI